MAFPNTGPGATVIPIGVPSQAPTGEPTTDYKWDGGYWRQNKQGRRVFYIYKKVGGKVYEVSTRTTREAAALEHYKRFQEDPAGYSPHGLYGKERLALTAELVDDFIRWSEAPKSKNGQQNTPAWVNKQVRVLAWWRGQFGDKDLRRLNVTTDIEEPAEKSTGTAEKIRVLKTFYSWLRKKKRLLSAGDDPTLDTLTTPQARSGAGKPDRAITRKQFQAVRRKLGKGINRDRLDVQAGTGWHTTELVRFAQGGSVEEMPVNAPKGTGAVGVLVCPLHKGGDPHRTAVSKTVLEAGQRVLKEGTFSREWYDRAVKAAAKKAKVTDFAPGSMRHSVATWGVDAGAALNEMSAFLGHKSPRTTTKFYARHSTPKKVPTLK